MPENHRSVPFQLERSSIGIWWDDGEHVVAFTQSPTEVEPVGGVVDSDMSHCDLWPEAAPLLNASQSDDYFSVPRGRVIWLPDKTEFRILHGTATGPDRLQVIAERFGLHCWTANLDWTYET